MSKEDYNPVEFNVPPRDHNGRPVKIRIRIQSAQSQAIDAIVASRRFPYTSKAALIRHAIQRLLKWLETLEDVPAMVAQSQMRTDAKEFEREMRTFEVRFQSLEMKVHHELAMGRRGQARKFLERMRGYLLAIESPYWRQRNLDELHKRWGYLLDGSSGSSEPSLLTPHNKTGAERARP